MLSKKKSEPQGPLFFFCSLGYEHTVIVTGMIVTGTDTWV